MKSATLKRKSVSARVRAGKSRENPFGQSRQLRHSGIGLAVCAGLASSLLANHALARTPAEAGPVLSLAQFLDQVTGRHDGVRASQNASAGARERSREGELLTSWTGIASAQYINDSTPSTTSFTLGTTQATAFSLGVSKLTDFGLTAKATYNLTSASLNNVPASFAPLLGSLSNYTGRLQLDFTQALWRNWGGAETQASQKAIQSAALLTSYSEAFKIKAALAEAESTYWRLALARETVAVTRETLARSEKIRDWNKQRAELNLADRSEYVQAEAAVNLRQLELESALDDERSAAHAFNTLRGIDSSAVREHIQPVDFTVEGSTRVPERAELREDVLAAREQSRLAAANARAGQEKNKPSLNAFLSAASAGKDPSLGTSVGNSLSASTAYVAAGLSFTAPLDFGLLGDARGGYRREQLAAEQNYSRKLFEQDRAWTDLVAQLIEGRHRLELAKKIESVQKTKLDLERDRHRRGRTTTYQVLLFEQDYATAQLSRIRAEAQLLSILAQMKTYSPASLSTSVDPSASKGGAQS